MRNFTYPDELYHFGVHGMKWGIRRYQNEDGTLTEAGRDHYAKESSIRLNKIDQKIARNKKFENLYSFKKKEYTKKYRKALKKEDDAKAKKFKNKIREAKSKVKRQEKDRLKNEKNKQELVNSLLKDNYDVKVKSIPRIVVTKGEIAAYMAIAAADTLFPFTAGLGTIYIASRKPVVQGQKYTVKNNE